MKKIKNKTKQSKEIYEKKNSKIFKETPKNK